MIPITTKCLETLILNDFLAVVVSCEL